MTELLAQASEHWHGGGWWFIAPLFWIFFWVLIIMVISRVFFWRRRGSWHHYHGWGGGENPFAVLAGRYARGEIDETEYRQRLEVLKSPPK